MSRRLLVAVPLLFAGGAAAARLTIAHAPAALANDLAQPSPVVFGWRGYGLLIWAMLAAVWFCCAWCVARACRDSGEAKTLGSRELAVLAVSALIAAMLWPVILSSDIYAYASFGERVLSGHSPYGALHASIGDAIDRASIWQWGELLPPDNYGPLFNALAAGVVRLSGGRAAIALAFFRIGACLACAACSALLWALLGDRDSAHQRVTVCAFALNPLVLWSAAEGHNDFYAIAIVLAGLLCAKRFPLFGGIVLALGALVKLPALAIALAFAFFKRDSAYFRMGVAIGIVAFCATSQPLFAATLERMGQPAVWPGHPMLYPWYATWLVPFFASIDRFRSASLYASAVAVATYVPDAYG